MLIVGITGNYGMGKSAVLSMFRELGAVTIDADWVVGQLLKEKKVLGQVKKLFGSGILDKKGQLDKKKVSEKIFKSKSLRLKLEDLLHPLVFKRIDEFIKGYKDGKKVFIVEAPVIFEREYEGRFDKTVTVFTDETTAINRLSMLGVTAKTASERLRCQLPIKEKIKRADFSIDNSGRIEKTKKQVEGVYKKLLEEAKIKELLYAGNVKDIKKILGRPYSIEGRVIKGAGRGGKLLHTPTANIAIENGTPIKEGVYAVRVGIAETGKKRRGDRGKQKITASPIQRFTYSPIYDGVANIGKNPTFGASVVSYEVHIFNFSGNLLGQKLRVYFMSRIRDEKKFPSVKALETRIKKDIKKAKEILERG